MGEFAVHPGKREERYMSNLQFFGLVGAIVSLACSHFTLQSLGGASIYVRVLPRTVCASASLA